MKDTIRNHYRETAIFFSRNTIAFALLLLMMLILMARMYYLQIIEYEQHTARSNTNRIKVQPLSPTRGLIVDQNGTLLADKTLQTLQGLLALEPDDLDSFHKRLKRRRRPLESVPLKMRLSEVDIAQIAVNLHALPGVAIEADLIRYYPLAELTAHSIGYVGRSKEAQTLDPAIYAGTHYIGKVGIEKSYEQTLLGTVGHQKVETNARGKLLRIVDQTDPIPGENLTLHLDIPTQRAATEALGEHRGSVVALDPKSGGILALVSTPAFNPNLFVTGIDHKTFNKLNLSRQRPLFNRAIKGQYPPGSTIKPMVGLAGLHHNIIDWEYKINDIGHFQLAGVNHLYRDWKRGGHGPTDLKKAIVESCDTYFYELSHKLTIDKLHDFLYNFGLGQHTHIDIPGERKGILPSREWKRAHRDLPWYPGETLITGIGQGFMLSTPTQLALATAIVANKGKLIRPHLVAKIGNTPTVMDELGHIEIQRPDEWNNILDSMITVVHGPNGTARKAGAEAAYTIAGKTGTAQVLGIKQNERYDAEKISEWHRDHALFIAFAPAEAPQIAVAVIVENAGGGGSNAAPVARRVLDAYLLPRIRPRLKHD